MKSHSFYINTDSPIHRIDPLTKLCYALCIIFITVVLGQVRFSLLCLLISVSLLLCADVFKKALPFFGIVTLVIVIVLIIRSIYYESLFTGVNTILIAYNIVGAFTVLALTSKPAELTGQLVGMGLPKAVVLNAFPAMKEQVIELESRAINEEGSKTSSNEKSLKAYWS